MRKPVELFRLICGIGLFCLIFIHPLPTASQTAEPTAAATAPATAGQPMMLGVNYEVGLWKDNEQAALDKLPLGIVRWGGDDLDKVENPTAIIQRFVTETRSANHAQPLYQVPFLFYELPSDEARQVRDVNITGNMGIKYWEIGNEPNYFHSSHRDNTTIDQYVKGWRDDAQAMLAVDPSITLVGPDVSMNLTPIDKTSENWQWFDAFLKADGDMVGVVSVHFYPFNMEDLTPDAIFANADLYAQNLVDLQSYIHDTLKRDVPLMINEIALSNGGQGNISPAGLYAGLWLADIFGISAEHEVAAVIPWTAVRNVSFSILDDSGTPRPTYYAIQAFAGLGPTVDTPAGLPTGVTGYHSQSASGEAIEVLVNRTAQAVVYTVGGTSVTLNPYSMTRLHFDTSGKLTDGTTYGQNEFTAKTGPSDALHPTTR